MRLGALGAPIARTRAATATLLVAAMSAEVPAIEPYSAARCGVLWDVDGTLVESTKLAFDATNEVLTSSGAKAVTVDDYKIGCRYTTPERFNFHLGLPEGSEEGARLGAIFDETYVKRVSKDSEMRPHVEELAIVRRRASAARASPPPGSSTRPQLSRRRS
jgi:beta-phosphoglucomutase-like phosphatase (HAD superfamily)